MPGRLWQTQYLVDYGGRKVLPFISQVDSSFIELLTAHIKWCDSCTIASSVSSSKCTWLIYHSPETRETRLMVIWSSLGSPASCFIKSDTDIWVPSWLQLGIPSIYYAILLLLLLLCLVLILIVSTRRKYILYSMCLCIRSCYKLQCKCVVSGFSTLETVYMHTTMLCNCDTNTDTVNCQHLCSACLDILRLNDAQSQYWVWA